MVKILITFLLLLGILKSLWPVSIQTRILSQSPAKDHVHNLLLLRAGKPGIVVNEVKSLAIDPQLRDSNRIRGPT